MKTFDEALFYLLSKAQVTQKTTQIAVREAFSRVLAQDIISPVNVPAYDNSMMDGYALHSYDLEHNNVFEVSQRIAAGQKGQPLKPGTVARIFTGAPIPEGANLVVMQEHTEEIASSENGQKTIQINEKTTRPGQNIRVIGEDITENAVILKQGQKLRAQDLGLISSIGLPEVLVYEPIKVATFTTGDELLEPGQAPEFGKVFNANRAVLTGAIQNLGFEWIDLGRVEDTLEATVAAMQKAASLADVVITTGGVSVGEEDHIKPAIEQLGSLDMWSVKMKPGKPLAYGQIGQTPFIGLPGNPVSAFATFNLFARPFLLKMQGANELKAKPLWLEADFEWLKPGFRREFARARLVNKYQKTLVEIFPNQGSGVLTSTTWADGFVVIPEDTAIQRGDVVAFYPFNPIQE
ncbi:gephyrin-like molybdotransferase Glp [Thiosulfativibrio zosterae]|uniref:Molybdopterin molybdenumtransferase n=1 Tax=Thiosulfativibrio zosterae TaxID=2675053 RepID=A0A6F8PQL9_9GAMM|nr:gephyrin-like molybdotransferase Glp [Thiosulfativibrio zosterae]BBP44334.1 molybdopterin molybdenumtransferase MoeA [Thiosulfativibrio zosterae]